MIFEGAPELPAERLFLWRVAYPLICWIVLTLLRVKVIGRANLPTRGPYILVSNHINWKDPPLLVFALDLDIRFMAKIQAFDLPVLGFLLRGIGSFAVRRGEGDRRALVTAIRVLTAGRVLGFFPEGHRSEDGTLLRAKPGIAFLVSHVPDVPVVPCSVSGTRRPIAALVFGDPVLITVGKPFLLKDLSDEERRDHQAIADGIMRRTALLLPPEMRGVYR